MSIDKRALKIAVVVAVSLGLIIAALFVRPALWSGSPGTRGGQDSPQGENGPCGDGAAAEYWVAPMDPAFRRDGPGKSPMGMDLVPVCGGPDASDDEVSISPQLLQHLGVRTARVERGVLQRTVETVGTVAYDETSFRMIHARAEGWVESLGARSEGDAVAAGDELYSMFSPKLVTAASEYLTVLASGRKDLEIAARQRLLALGYDERQLAHLRQDPAAAQRFAPRAPGAAVVAMLGVREGQFVMPGTHMMTLASLRTVWVIADVLERDAARIRGGQGVRVAFGSHPGHSWHAEVDYIYPTLDPRTRTLKFRLVLNNPDGLLLPNMFARVSVATTAEGTSLLAPGNALIRDGRGERVVLALGEGRFRIVPVRVGAFSADRVEIVDGLNEGDEVVIDGQFMIDSEANVDAESRRFMAPEDPLIPMADLAEDDVPRGQMMAVIRGLNGGRIDLEHEPISALGEAGIDMPAMRMSFELGAEVEQAELAMGQTVHVIVASPAPGRFVVTQVHVVGSGGSLDDGAGQ